MPKQDTESKAARRRGGFSMPTNPAQALQEMIRQERGEGSTSAEGGTVAVPTSIEVVDTTGSAVAQTTNQPTLQASAATAPPPSSPQSAVAEKEAPPVVHTTTLPVGSTTDPIRAAVLLMLQQPIAGDLAKGPHTVTSIKVHQAIWERLGHVAQITGRNKQDLVGEALMDLFAKILRDEGQGRG